MSSRLNQLKSDLMLLMRDLNSTPEIMVGKLAKVIDDHVTGVLQNSTAAGTVDLYDPPLEGEPEPEHDGSCSIPAGGITVQ